MMGDDDIISSDHPLTRSQRDVLCAILETLIPSSDDGIMPGAGELDLVGYIEEEAPDFADRLTDIINCFDEDFASKPYSARYEIVDEFRGRQPQLFETLLFHTYARYYQDDRVLVGIGSKAGPPFPQGNSVEAGDLALLDPVVKLQRRYR
jgi:hypothetical protein